MEPLSRRTVLGGAAAGFLTAAGLTLGEELPPGDPASVAGDAPYPHRPNGDGAPIVGPTNPELQKQNPDLIAPPPTDHGKMMNLHFPFSYGHVKLEPGGWSREVTVRELPISTQMAGVNMRLKKGAFRELHWHATAEWAFMIKGNARITAMNPDGSLFVDDVTEGDLWFFPKGIPHSIQGLDSDLPDGGTEFLLVFDDGGFSEDSTFLLTDWFAHTPPEIVARQLQTTPDQLKNIPKKELFIYPGEMPDDLTKEQTNRGAKKSPANYKFSMLKQTPDFEGPGGKVHIADSLKFPVSKALIAAYVEVQPGAFRELHWHTIGDEWQYYISGFGRMTVFNAAGAARTFNFQGGDVGYIPATAPHYIQNLGNEPLRFLEVFKADVYDDLSARQWMAFTPPNLVASHLMCSKEILAKLDTKKTAIIAKD